MPGAIGDPRQADDAIVYIDMRVTTNTATRGDVIAFTASGARAVSTGNTVALWPYSAIGIALGQNPIWDSQGSASANGKLPVARRGIFRVSAVPGDTGTYSAGQLVFPISTGSGIVGQTGRTGQAAVWSATATIPGLVSAVTAVIVSASGVGVAVTTGTAYYERYTVDPTSAIGQIVRVVSQASGATAQLDIILRDVWAMNSPLRNR